jgi:hypothetical protein
MKSALVALVPVALFASVFATGCSGSSSSPFGADPNFTQIQSRMAHPDGTFAPQKAGNVFSQFGSLQSSSSSAGVAGSSATPTSSTKSYRPNGLKLADAMGDAKNTCTDMKQGNLTGNCACPGGGSFAYDFSEYKAQQSGANGSADVTARVAMSQCVSSNGDMIDGKEFVHLHADKSSAASNASFLLVLDATLRVGGVSHTVDVNALFDESSSTGTKVQIAVQVDDGWVVVEASASADGKSGSYTVRDKNGSWTCSATNGAGSCTGADGAAHSFTAS